MAEKKTPEESRNHFAELYAVNVNGKTEKKNGLTYLSWAFAVAEFFKAYPDATYEVVKFNGLPYVYDPRTGYVVYTKVTAGGITREMWLPVMDGANKAMRADPYQYTAKNPLHKYATKHEDGHWRDKYGNEQPEYIRKTCDAATMFDINKTIMRCLVKNFAMFGLGLYIYAGEDLPEEIEDDRQEQPKAKASEKTKKAKQEQATAQISADDRITEEMAAALEARCNADNVDMTALCCLFKVTEVREMTLAHLRNVNDHWDQVKDRCGK